MYEISRQAAYEGIPLRNERSDLLFNHVAPSLSVLDLEMVRSIPPGGNWKDIPLGVARRSARVMRIRQRGGRTTYYGRLRPDMPAYTINTYFHRPGNGTFIHYAQDRTISYREAARLQSFPDDYVFVGPRNSLTRQIGNAVPPLMAYAVGRQLQRGRTVDLFAGAGGLSEGLSYAGHSVIAAFDHVPAMCTTYALNHPDTQVRCVDLATETDYRGVLEAVNEALRGRTLTLLAGGPPCQGFSTAGLWDSRDPRNRLIRVMLQAAQDLSPLQVVIENVTGLKWMLGGQILGMIIERLTQLGYHVTCETLRAEEYGVPQRRRRVFIVATESPDGWSRPEPCFAAVPRGATSVHHLGDGHLEPPVTVEEAISDLPGLVAGGGADIVEYNRSATWSAYQCYSRGSLSPERFLRIRGGL